MFHLGILWNSQDYALLPFFLSYMPSILWFFAQHYFEMQDGVIHDYPNKDCKLWASVSCLLCFNPLIHYWDVNVCFVFPLFLAKEELFPVADATTFFTDLHHILRVIAIGNIRTLCHHRLNLLEQVNTSFIDHLNLLRSYFSW
jgi:hypothetical protein